MTRDLRRRHFVVWLIMTPCVILVLGAAIAAAHHARVMTTAERSTP